MGLTNKQVMTGKSVVAFMRIWNVNLLEMANELTDFSFREKLHYVARQCYIVPYRITDTGGLVEYTKAIGRKIVKELGKKARRNLWEMPCRA